MSAGIHTSPSLSLSLSLSLFLYVLYIHAYVCEYRGPPEIPDFLCPRMSDIELLRLFSLSHEPGAPGKP